MAGEKKNGNGNGNGGQGRAKRVTKDDLAKAAAAAAEASARVASALGAGGEDIEEEGEIIPEHGTPAFQGFMARLAEAIDRGGRTLHVTENAAWVKIESTKNGHKIYISKGKNQVNRVESTLPPEIITGATEPGRPNGRIASWIPAEVGAVEEAIDALSTLDTGIRPPARAVAKRPGGAPGSGSITKIKRRGLN